MWDLYGKGSGIVAVKTTVGLLRRALDSLPQQVFVAAVNYVDWSAALWDNNMLVMCARKDLSYEHESEVRAMVWDCLALARPNELGISVPFDPATFLTEVVVGPREQLWVTPLVDEVLRRYGMTLPVSTSNRLKRRC